MVKKQEEVDKFGDVRLPVSASIKQSGVHLSDSVS